MKWIWIRHGETDVNGNGCYLGHLDPALNARGYEQITSLADHDWQVTNVFSSDLLRCKQTADLLVCSDKIQYTEALRELNFGDWEGKRYEEIMQAEAERLTAWYQNPFHHSPPNGETLKQLGDRVDDWLRDQLNRFCMEDVILVVTHGGPLRWILSHWILRDANHFWEVRGAPHGGGFVVDWDGDRWSLPQFFGGKV